MRHLISWKVEVPATLRAVGGTKEKTGFTAGAAYSGSEEVYHYHLSHVSFFSINNPVIAYYLDDSSWYLWHKRIPRDQGPNLFHDFCSAASFA
ncbi:hypothetical protein [Pontibacter kalidii]|uniref:hypothetical protein n=1 Tax=Pontibacter kalidii TaxID=2592049 RepID=UPI0022532D0A|nr:hypothetical protein [Pontibacter kalidii]